MTDPFLSHEHPDHPFRPYRGVHFEAGLDETDRRAMARAQMSGDCIGVHYLVIKGFLQLYPFLRPAFEDTEFKRKHKLETTVVGDFSPATDRCQMVNMISVFWARRHDENVAPLDMAPLLAAEHRARQTGTAMPDQKTLFDINFRLGLAAFCDDYAPAIGDVRNLANSPGGMIVTSAEELYLTERARVHGLIDHETYRRDVARIGDGAIPPDRLRYFMEASRLVKLPEIIDMPGFWPKTCRGVVKAGLAR